MQYRREIDGLRAISVLPVIFFHAGFPLFGGGFVGVDVFFVISGYLITSLILLEKQAGIFSLVKFYERRARRILPPLFLVMLLCIPFAWWWMMPVDFKSFSRSLVAVSLFTSNMLFGRESGYFDNAAEFKPLLHTWSLAIEEQYYLFFPMFLLLVWRLGKPVIIGLCVAVAMTSLLFAHWKSFSQPAEIFYFLPARIWELLVGVFVAFYLHQRQQKITTNRVAKELLSLIGVAFIAYAVFRFDSTTPFPSLYALIPTLGAALIILFAGPTTWVGYMLSRKPLVGLGLISYSAYLWHQPLFAFARIRSVESPSVTLLLVLAAVSLGLAYASWRYVEKPFRNPALVSRRQFLKCALAGSFLFIMLGSVGRVTKGFEHYFIAHRLDASEQSLYALIKQHTGGDMALDMGDDGACNFWVKSIDAQFTKRFDACHKKYGKAVIVLGDSHAMNIYNALYRAKFSPFLVSVSQVACRPYETLAHCHYEDFSKFVVNYKMAVQAVIFNQSGSHLLRDYLGREDGADIFMEGRKYSVDYDHIQKTTDYLARLSRDAKVIWLGPFTEARVNFHNFRKEIAAGFRIHPHTIAIFSGLDQELSRILVASQTQFRYVSMAKLLQIESDFLLQGDCITYRDVDHFSVCGEKIVGEKMRPALHQLFN